MPTGTELRNKITMGEVGYNELRENRLTYGQVLDKYDTWKGQAAESTMKGGVRKLARPKDQTVRNPTVNAAGIRAMRRAFPNCKDKKATILWTQVKAAVFAETGKSYGSALLHTTWEDLDR